MGTCLCANENEQQKIKQVDSLSRSSTYRDFDYLDVQAHQRTEEDLPSCSMNKIYSNSSSVNDQSDVYKHHQTSPSLSSVATIQPQPTHSSDDNSFVVYMFCITFFNVHDAIHTELQIIGNEDDDDKEMSEDDDDDIEIASVERINSLKVFVKDPSKSMAVISENKHSNDSPYRIQVEQLPQFEAGYKWILDKDRQKESPASTTPTLKAFNYDKALMSQKRVTLSDNHNFLWFTSIVRGSLSTAKELSEITRSALDKVLNLLPVPYRNKIWEICNIDEDSFVVVEDFEEFVDAILIATGQFEIDLDDEEAEDLMFELRDMTNVFKEIVNIDKIWKEPKNVTKTVSKNRFTLSTKGATKIIMRLRNLEKESDIAPNDISIPLLTGFTKKAIKHSIKYCTRIFWKTLTDIWWDEDDEDDMALPAELDEYEQKRRHSRQRSSKISQQQRKHLSQTSIDSLFGTLIAQKSFSVSVDDEEDEMESYQNDNRFLKV